jgi:hypothetical protein
MDDGIDPRVLASVDKSRRDLLRKLLLNSAFVLPTVASFPMDALAETQNPIRTFNGATTPLLGTNPGGAGRQADPVIPGRTNEPAKR